MLSQAEVRNKMLRKIFDNKRFRQFIQKFNYNSGPTADKEESGFPTKN